MFILLTRIYFNKYVCTYVHGIVFMMTCWKRKCVNPYLKSGPGCNVTVIVQWVVVARYGCKCPVLNARQTETAHSGKPRRRWVVSRLCACRHACRRLLQQRKGRAFCLRGSGYGEWSTNLPHVVHGEGAHKFEYLPRCT